MNGQATETRPSPAYMAQLAQQRRERRAAMSDSERSAEIVELFRQALIIVNFQESKRLVAEALRLSRTSDEAGYALLAVTTFFPRSRRISETEYQRRVLLIGFDMMARWGNM